MAYFHPKSGSEVEISKEYVKVLTGTAQEVRYLLNKTSERPIMPETVKSLYDLLDKIILNSKIPIHQILEYRKDKTTRDLAPEIFEGMWTIAFALGAVRGYESVTLQSGKVETGLTPIPKQEVLEFLKKTSIRTSAISGASDISFSIGSTEDSVCESSSADCAPREETAISPSKKYVFCTVKFFGEDESKSVASYDIANIMAAAASAGYSEDDYRILVLVNNKDAAKTVFEHARRRYMTKPVKRGEILGRSDLEAAFTQLRERVASAEDSMQFIQSTFLGVKPPRPFLSLRFHQELVVQKTLDIVKKGERSTVLWGVVARGGKTYICGGLIRAMQPKHVFIVAGAYTETNTQFLDQLLDTSKCGFQDFADYTVINVKNDKFTYDSGKKYIFFLSSELLKGTGKNAKEREAMALVTNKKIVPDLVFFDEIHKGGTTQLADEAMALIGSSAFKVFMTATYVKPFIKPEYNIDVSNLITWGYGDIQMAKTLTSEDTLKYFETKYGKELCTRVLDLQRSRGVSMEDIEAQYIKFPEIQFLTTMFSPSFQESMIRQNILDPKAGFSLRALLAVTPACMKTPFATRYKCLKNGITAGLFLNYIGPSSSQMETLDGAAIQTIASSSEHIVDRIGRNSQLIGDRLSNINKQFKPHSQLWFLPQPIGDGNETPLIAMMTSLASLLQQHPWFAKHFCVAVVASTFKPTEEELPFGTDGFIAFTNGGANTKETVLALEAKAYSKKRGLLILAGKMLTLGISLPCVDVVALIDDSESSDLTYQKMFRALTESDGKKVGYVIDVNPVRTLKTLYDYTTVEQTETNPSGADEVDAVTLTNLYLIDQDQMFTVGTDNQRISSDAIHGKINEVLQEGRKIYKSIVDEAASKLLSIDLKEEVDSLKDALNPSKPQALQIALDLAGTDETTIPSGLERIETSEPTKKEKDDKKYLIQSLREMILTSFVMLAFLTTATTFDEAIQKYQMNADGIRSAIYQVLKDRGLVKETTSEETVHNVLGPALVKSQSQITHPYFRMHKKFSDPANDHREVIEFIEQNLKPKREQVASRGEVFTPLDLVQEMLTRIPKSVLSDPNTKWLDPANGIGNFPVIAFTLLDTHLQTVSGYEDAATRHKHIVENMLYMVELDTANVRLSRRLLEKMCGRPGCKLNVLNMKFEDATDSVLQEAFGVNRFDVIMGNPPYNAGGVTKGGGTVWPVFVRRAFELVKPNGYITFVHPPGWRKPYDPSERENQGKIWYTIRQNKWNIDYLNLDDTPRFDSTPVTTDYYLIRAGEGTETQYNARYMNIVRQGTTTLPFTFIPNMIDPITTGIVQKLLSAKGLKLNIVYNQYFKPAASDRNNTGIPHYHFTKRTGEREFYNLEYAKVPEYINQPKVLMQSAMGYEKGRLFAFYEPTPVGTTNNTMYMIADETTGPKLVEFLNSDIVTFLMKITQYSMESHRRNEYKILNLLNMPASMEEYGLTQEEKSLIQQIVHKPISEARTKTPRRKRSPNATVRNPIK